jgi:hypothetical protein
MLRHRAEDLQHQNAGWRSRVEVHGKDARLVGFGLNLISWAKLGAH